VKGEIDLSETLYEIYIKNPEFLDVLRDLGYNVDLRMIETLGRLLSLPKDGKNCPIDVDKIKKELIKRGYIVYG